MNRELLQQVLTVLKEWDALIKFQYSGTSEAMTAMQYAAWHTVDAISAIEQELAKFDTPESHIVKWAEPVDPNNFGEKLAKPEQKGISSGLCLHPSALNYLDKKKVRTRLDYQPYTGVGEALEKELGESNEP